ncbi:response regulator [Ruminococcaceae bacterium OttesenSCG-928-L11]|nr:response regulator [Ruminococcaceae bacterium OttesenSCG-928-L11]
MTSLLIADDEKVIRESLAGCLDWESIGIQVVGCCANGLDALDAIIDESPDIVLTDIKMPGLSGLELVQKMQDIDRDIEFIILSGYREFDFAQKAIELGVRRYLLKPVSEEQVLEAVTDAMGSCQRRHAAGTAASDAMRRLLDQLPALAAEGQAEEAVTRVRDFLAGIKDRDILRAESARLVSGLMVQGYSKEDSDGIFDSIYREEDPRVLVDSIVETVQLLLQEEPYKYNIVEQVKLYVKHHLADSNLSLKKIASQYAHMNVDYLSRLFVQETGEKFSHYLNSQRMEKAKQLLQMDSSKVFQVAEQVGLGHNPRYFGQVFKKYTGQTPSVYLEQQGKKSAQGQ